MKKIIISILAIVILFLTNISLAETDLTEVIQSDKGHIFVTFYFLNDTGFDLKKFEAQLNIYETSVGLITTKSKIFHDGIKQNEKKTYSIDIDLKRYVFGNAEVIITNGWRRQ